MVGMRSREGKVVMAPSGVISEVESVKPSGGVINLQRSGERETQSSWSMWNGWGGHSSSGARIW